MFCTRCKARPLHHEDTGKHHCRCCQSELDEQENTESKRRHEEQERANQYEYMRQVINKHAQPFSVEIEEIYKERIRVLEERIELLQAKLSEALANCQQQETLKPPPLPEEIAKSLERANNLQEEDLLVPKEILEKLNTRHPSLTNEQATILQQISGKYSDINTALTAMKAEEDPFARLSAGKSAKSSKLNKQNNSEAKAKAKKKV